MRAEGRNDPSTRRYRSMTARLVLEHRNGYVDTGIGGSYGNTSHEAATG